MNSPEFVPDPLSKGFCIAFISESGVPEPVPNWGMAVVLSESVLDQNGPNDHFGQNDLIPNRILAFARPKWTKMVHFGPKRSILVHQPYFPLTLQPEILRNEFENIILCS